MNEKEGFAVFMNSQAAFSASILEAAVVWQARVSLPRRAKPKPDDRLTVDEHALVLGVFASLLILF